MSADLCIEPADRDSQCLAQECISRWERRGAGINELAIPCAPGTDAREIATAIEERRDDLVVIAKRSGDFPVLTIAELPSFMRRDAAGDVLRPREPLTGNAVCLFCLSAGGYPYVTAAILDSNDGCCDECAEKRNADGVVIGSAGEGQPGFRPIDSVCATCAEKASVSK